MTGPTSGTDVPDYEMDLENFFDFSLAASGSDCVFALSNIGLQMDSKFRWQQDVPSGYSARDPAHGTSGTDNEIAGLDPPEDDMMITYPEALGDFVDSQILEIFPPPDPALLQHQTNSDATDVVSPDGKAPADLISLQTASVPFPLDVGPTLTRVRSADGIVSQTPNRLNKEQVGYLSTWLHDHRDKPYPTVEEIGELVTATGLETRRIRNWFARNRKKLAKSTGAGFSGRGDTTGEVPLVSITETYSNAPLSNALANSSLTSIQQPSQRSSSSVASLTESTRAKYGPDVHFTPPSDLEISYCEWWLKILPDASQTSTTFSIEPLSSDEYSAECVSVVPVNGTTDAVSHLLAAAAEHMAKGTIFDLAESWERATSSARLGVESHLSSDADDRSNQITKGRKRTFGSQSLSSIANSNWACSEHSAGSYGSKRRRLISGSGSYGSVTSGSMSLNSYSSHVPRRGRKLNFSYTRKLESRNTSPDSLDFPSVEMGKRTVDRVDPQGCQTQSDRKSRLTYQCTHCRQEFAKKSVWERHEAAMHYHPVVWICDVPTKWKKWRECRSRPVAERTYYRRDAFRQHLSGWHGLSKGEMTAQFIDQYMHGRATDPESLVCHFCGSVLKDWPERTQHVANHFEHGYTMDSWMSTAPRGAERVFETVHFAVRRLRDRTLSFADALLDIPVLPKLRKSDPLARAIANY